MPALPVRDVAPVPHANERSELLLREALCFSEAARDLRGEVRRSREVLEQLELHALAGDDGVVNDKTDGVRRLLLGRRLCRFPS